MMVDTYLAAVVTLSLAVECIGQTVPMNCSDTGCGRNAQCDQGLGVCQCDQRYFSPNGENMDCRSKNASDQRCSVYDSDCVYCGPAYQGPCQKCTNFIQSETCTNECEEFVITVITVASSTLTSKVCSDPSRQGLPEWAIIVFAVTGVVIVAIGVGLLIGLSVLFLNRSSHGHFDVEDINQEILAAESPAGTLRTARSNSFSFKNEDERKTSKEVHLNPTLYSITGSDEELRFMQKLEYLRAHAEVFLKMLNDMRRRLKELSPDSPAAQQYRNVMRDVTRLLYLLNKKTSNIEIPADGITLLEWSEKILQRYLKSKGMIPKPNKTTNRLSVLGPQDETQF